MPVIAISAAANAAGNEHILPVAESVGARFSLAKPLDDVTLLHTVSEALLP